MKSYDIIGLMSGSSLDGLDIVHCKMSSDSGKIAWELVRGSTLAFSEQWQARLHNLPEQNALIFCKTHAYFGHYLAELVAQFISEQPFEPNFIASHGHTIFHDPEKRLSVQIGDGAALAALSGYPVICDFRTQDVALDGEGAPLAPIADKLLFPGYDFYLNLGGIANISCDTGKKHIAFDICAANQVLNALAQEMGLNYDAEGQLARQGKVLPELLTIFNDKSYFGMPYPKSIGNGWVREAFIKDARAFEASIPDKLRTVSAHIAEQTAASIQQIIQREGLQKSSYQLFSTGGGTYNQFLMECIEESCNEQQAIKLVIPTSDVIDYKEALLIALLGFLRQEGLPNCMSSVTGARFDTISGAIHQGSKQRL